jgi:hypothetical protein
MKFFLIILLLFLSHQNTHAQKGFNKEMTAWSFLYGYGRMDQDIKEDQDLTPTGSTYKFSYGKREKYFDYSIMFRYGTLNDDFSFSNIDGEILHNNFSVGGQLGFWLFSWLNIHVGYARHAISESIKGSFTEPQKDSIREKYKISSEPTSGLYAGGDLVLVKTERFQLFTNYDYYHLNGREGHVWEAMMGLRFYFNSTRSSPKSNWLGEMFKFFWESSTKP